MNRPPKDFHQAIVNHADKSHGVPLLACKQCLIADFAVATVLKAAGSTPCKAGAKAIIDISGAIIGTIGGGAVEARAQQLAAAALKTACPLVFDFYLEGDAVEGAEPICGGMMRVLVDPMAARRGAAYKAAASTRQRREQGLLLTTIRVDNTPESNKVLDINVLFLAEAEISAGTAFPTNEALRSVLTRGEAALFIKESPQKGERLEVLAEPLVPNPLLVIAGGGHVGQALALQADLVGFDILVIDDRREFTAAELFPEGATARCGSIAEEIARLPAGDDTYIVIVTRGTSTTPMPWRPA